jgi:mycothiol synthase
VRQVRGRLSRPNYHPDQDLFIVEDDDHIVGYSDITTEVNIGRIVIDCFVLPEYWPRSVTTELLSRAEGRGSELKVRVAQVNIAQDNEIARCTLSRLGFKPVRRFLVLRLKMADVPEPATSQATRGYRHLKRGEEAKLTQLQNRSFAETWGYSPTSIREISYHLNLAGNRPDDVIVASDEDRLVGYCWTKTGKDDPASSIAQVFMFGVDPDYRGRGIGQGVLLTALGYLKSKGAQIVELTVDSNNHTAYSLYQSVGFRSWTSSLWFEKPIASLPE